MNLHGERVARGDAVFDICLGYGRVTRAPEEGASLTVEFPSGNQVAYTPNGVSIASGRATLFYHDPFIVNPPKNLAQWANAKAVVVSVTNLLSGAN